MDTIPPPRKQALAKTHAKDTNRDIELGDFEDENVLNDEYLNQPYDQDNEEDWEDEEVLDEVVDVDNLLSEVRVLLVELPGLPIESSAISVPWCLQDWILKTKRRIMLVRV